MITFTPYPIPVIVVEDGKEGYLLYVEPGGQHENDLWTIVLCDGGGIITCNITQIKIYQNATFGIKKDTTTNP